MMVVVSNFPDDFQPSDRDRPSTELYKADGRSRVWRVDTPRGAYVIKRYDHFPMKQRLAALFGKHPAQREMHWSDNLARLAIRAAPIVAAGVSQGRRWLAMPHIGPSLLWRIREPDLSLAERRDLAEELAAMLELLAVNNLLNRDLKTSNILVDDHGRLWLIDLAGVRRVEDMHTAVVRMLRTLDRTARDEGASRTDRLRVIRRFVRRQSKFGPVRELIANVLEDK